MARTPTKQNNPKKAPKRKIKTRSHGSAEPNTVTAKRVNNGLNQLVSHNTPVAVPATPTTPRTTQNSVDCGTTTADELKANVNVVFKNLGCSPEKK